MKTVAILQFVAAIFASNATPAGGDFFDEADQNGDEVLTIEEITSLRPGTTPEIFKLVDQDGNGMLDYDEFEQAVEQGYLHVY